MLKCITVKTAGKILPAVSVSRFSHPSWYFAPAMTATADKAQVLPVLTKLFILIVNLLYHSPVMKSSSSLIEIRSTLHCPIPVRKTK